MEVRRSTEAHSKPSIEQQKEDEHVGWRKAGQEKVDQLWNELALKSENEVLIKIGIEEEERKAYIGRGERPTWKEGEVTVKQGSTWRRAQALAMEAQHNAASNEQQTRSSTMAQCRGVRALQHHQKHNAVICKKKVEAVTEVVDSWMTVACRIEIYATIEISFGCAAEKAERTAAKAGRAKKVDKFKERHTQEQSG